MIETLPPGAFPIGVTPYQAGPKLWTSRMFPLLEPYTERHRQYFKGLLMGYCSGEPCVCDIQPPPTRDKLFILLEDFVFAWQADDGTWYKLVIPAGFVTDIASIPLIIQLLLRMRGDGPIRTAALPHDLMYQLKKMLEDVAAIFEWEENVLPATGTRYGGWAHDTRPWTKGAMDKFFAKVMKAYGVKLSTATYLGVRWGGHIAYHRDDPSRFYTAALYELPPDVRNSWEG